MLKRLRLNGEPHYPEFDPRDVNQHQDLMQAIGALPVAATNHERSSGAPTFDVSKTVRPLPPEAPQPHLYDWAQDDDTEYQQN